MGSKWKQWKRIEVKNLRFQKICIHKPTPFVDNDDKTDKEYGWESKNSAVCQTLT